MNEEYVFIQKAVQDKQAKVIEYSHSHVKTQTIVLEDGKPLFVWMYPDVNYSNLSEAVSQFYPDAYVGIMKVEDVDAKWMGVIDNNVHVYEVVAIPIIY